jgi:hypothetical protein
MAPVDGVLTTLRQPATPRLGSSNTLAPRRSASAVAWSTRAIWT